MHQIIYTSVASQKMDVGALSDLLVEARDKNERIDVTGLLLYKNGSFMQAFEGQEETVHRLYDTIKGDERHRGVITLSQEPIDGRNFPDWQMGFRHLGDADPDALPKGFSKLFAPDYDPTQFSVEPSYAREALLGFKEATP